MLTREELEIIGTVLAEFALRGQGGASHSAELLARLPPSDEGLETFIRQAREQGLTWVGELAATLLEARRQTPPPPPTGPVVTEADFVALLDSSAPARVQIEALLKAVPDRPPFLARLARERLTTPDPFVLATLASVLGRVGVRADVLHLMPLLDHADHRVVANALEAMYRHHVEVPETTLERLLTADDDRVRVQALALCGIADPQRSLEQVAALTRSSDPGRRASVAYLLGELAHRARAVELLLAMLIEEDQVTVLRRLSSSLLRQTGPAQAPAVVETLRGRMESSGPAKASLLKDLIHDLSRENGLDQARPAGTALRPDTPPAARIAGTIVSPVLNLADEIAQAQGPVPGASTDLRQTLRTRPFAALMHRLTRAGRQLAALWTHLRTDGRWLDDTRWEASRSTVLAAAGGAGLLCVGFLLGASRAPVSTADPGATVAVGTAKAGLTPGSKNAPPAAGPAPAAVAVGPAAEAPPFRPTGGGTVSLEGQVVAVKLGKPLIWCAGRHYILVGGGRPDTLDRGAKLKMNAKIVGITLDGLIMVEGT